MSSNEEQPESNEPVAVTKVRRLRDFNGSANLYQLSRPVSHGEGMTDHVVVSAVVVPFSGPETYIFAANAAGEVINWSEMEGSYRGGLDLAQAIRGAGWTFADA